VIARRESFYSRGVRVYAALVRAGWMGRVK
jgi:hypothetical protein